MSPVPIPREQADLMAAGDVLDVESGQPTTKGSASKQWADETAASIIGLTSEGATRYHALPVEVSAIRFLGTPMSMLEVGDWVKRRGGDVTEYPPTADVPAHLHFPETGATAMNDDWVVIDQSGNIEVWSDAAFLSRFTPLVENQLHFVLPGDMTIAELINELRGR